MERSPSGLGRRTGNAVWGNPSRVQIPPSPPLLSAAEPRGPTARRFREPKAASAAARCYRSPGRARRGTSGALYLQSAPAGLNSLPRSPFSKAAATSDVEDRVPRSGDSRTVSGPEGSSTKRSSPGAAERPGPSRSWRWARERPDRRRVHGNPPDRGLMLTWRSPRATTSTPSARSERSSSSAAPARGARRPPGCSSPRSTASSGLIRAVRDAFPGVRWLARHRPPREISSIAGYHQTPSRWRSSRPMTSTSGRPRCRCRRRRRSGGA